MLLLRMLLFVSSYIFIGPCIYIFPASYILTVCPRGIMRRGKYLLMPGKMPYFRSFYRRLVDDFFWLTKDWVNIQIRVTDPLMADWQDETREKTRPSVNFAKDWLDHSFSFLVLSGLEKGFTLDVITRGQSTNIFLCIWTFSAWWRQTNKRSCKPAPGCKWVGEPGWLLTSERAVFCKNQFIVLL